MEIQNYGRYNDLTRMCESVSIWWTVGRRVSVACVCVGDVAEWLQPNCVPDIGWCVATVNVLALLLILGSGLFRCRCGPAFWRRPVSVWPAFPSYSRPLWTGWVYIVSHPPHHLYTALVWTGTSVWRVHDLRSLTFITSNTANIVRCVMFSQICSTPWASA